MKPFTATAATLLACGLYCGQAAGSVSASVRLTGLAFSVTDLTPNDGVAPFYELLPSGLPQSTASVFRDEPAFSGSDQASAILADVSVSKTFSDGASALGKVSSDSVESQAAGPTGSSYLLQASANLLGSRAAPLIRITPGTRLNFSGNAELLTNASCAGDCYAIAALELDFGYYGEEGSFTRTITTNVGDSAGVYRAPVGLSYANTSTEDQYLGLVVHANVEIANTAAVPEPANWALVAGGGLLATWWRRRARPVS